MDNQRVKTVSYGLRDLPIGVVECDGEQPRRDLDTEIMVANLKPSIAHHGIQQPITVTEYKTGKYRIIDGHRRYKCAKDLGFTLIPCLIYPDLDPGEMEVRRYEMQNLRRPWKPLERSDAFLRMKEKLGFRSIREMAEYIGISEGSVANYLELRNQQLHLLSRFEKNNLGESYQTEIVRLKPHLCKVGDFEANEIIDNIMERIVNDKIRNSKEIRVLKSAFIRIDLYADLIANYLQNPDMKLRELEEQILRTGFSWNVQKVVADIAKKKSKGEKLTEKEQDALKQLRKLIEEVL
ncbi:MAG: ParB/RepB/Spo0J family partition protein [Patescibacteria group bacterium]